MVSNITPLESRCDLRRGNQFNRFMGEIKGPLEEFKEIKNDEINGIYNSIINGMKRSISYACAEYEKNAPMSENGKKLKKELSDEIGLLKKMNASHNANLV